MNAPARESAVRLIEQLHGARVAGDLAGMCRLFAPDGLFEIAGASADKPIAISALGLAQFRPWLMMMVKVFRLSDYRMLSLVVEPPKVVAQWRVDIHSKVTGISVTTELVDLVEIRDGLIINYSEFFVPRPGPGPVPRRFRQQ